LFSTQHWYLILSNHQSWVDIFVLFHIFRGKIPFLKFFLKSKLKWIPIVGWAWWALDYPFMKRYQPHQIAKNPKLKEKDHQTALAACRKFARTPTSVINFVEGTRFTPKKKEQQKSPFNHLLRPKAGGISQVLRVLGHQLNHILDVTIVYPDGSPSFWQYLTGKVTRVSVLIHALPVSKDLIGDYQSDPHFRQAFQEWLNELWHKKDQTIEVLLQSSSDRLDPQNPGVAHASS
jgi:1-acyl-sn-glycerol-3-phosphate acyltransferase